MKDNRKYDWSGEKASERFEYSHIEKWVPQGAKVIDLGCGNGSLLKLLKDKKEVKGFGVEITETGVKACLEKGIDARVGRIDEALKDIPGNAFDLSICNVTLEWVMYPEVTLSEMKRISARQIISINNFAFLPQRMELMFSGSMPRTLSFGYDWFSTGAVHRLTIKDFKRTVGKAGLKIKDAVYSPDLKHFLRHFALPNLLAAEAVFLLEK